MTSTTLSSSNAGSLATTTAQDTLTLIGRVLIASLFIPAGFNKLMGFAGTVGYISSVGLPLPQVAAAIAIIVELGFGILLLVGYRVRLTGLVMAIFTIATAVFFHNYWAMVAEKVAMNQLNFYKNMAIAGGLFAFAAFGGGRFGIDKR